jgi:phosphoglycolate phosphatase
MPRLVLWDIDHTLIENAGASKEIYASAFEILTGRRARHTAQTEGRTDPDIMVRLLQMHGDSPIPWRRVQPALETAGANHRQALTERGMVLPGASQLIAALAETSGVVQTVVTGNIRANAEVKLSALGLSEWIDLDVGGYGSDHRERSRLVVLARHRAAAKHGAAFGDKANAVVIGDTPRDIEAAQCGGARMLAVASGVHTLDELRAAGGTCVMPSLMDTSAVLEYVLAGAAETPPDAHGHSRTYSATSWTSHRVRSARPDGLGVPSISGLLGLSEAESFAVEGITDVDHRSGRDDRLLS